MGKKLILDMDGTLFRFHDEIDYLERMYEKDFFRNLKPFENMIEGIRLFIKNNPDIEVYTCSSVIQSPYCIEEKNAAIDEYLPEIDKNHRLYPNVMESKAALIPGGVDKDTFLLDDYNLGLNRFLYEGGSAIKVHNNVNMRGTGAFGGDKDYRWTGDIIHTDDHPEIICAELESVLGLEYQLEHLCQETGVKLVQDISERRGPGFYLYPVEEKMGMTGFHENGYEAHKMTDIYSGHIQYFKNPFNAIRWLSGDEESREYYISENLSLSKLKLESLLTNMRDAGKHISSNLDIPSFLTSEPVREQIESEYEKCKQPLIGIIEVGNTKTFYYSKEDLLWDQLLLEQNFEAGKVKTEWFIPENIVIKEKEFLNLEERIKHIEKNRGKRMDQTDLRNPNDHANR